LRIAATHPSHRRATSIVWGDADGIIAPVYAQEYAKRIAGARIELIDQAERAVEAVGKFLGSS